MNSVEATITAASRAIPGLDGPERLSKPLGPVAHRPADEVTDDGRADDDREEADDERRRAQLEQRHAFSSRVR